MDCFRSCFGNVLGSKLLAWSRSSRSESCDLLLLKGPEGLDAKLPDIGLEGAACENDFFVKRSFIRARALPLLGLSGDAGTAAIWLPFPRSR